MAVTGCSDRPPRIRGGLAAMIEALRRRMEARRAMDREREIIRRFAGLDDSLLADMGLRREDIVRIARETGVRL